MPICKLCNTEKDLVKSHIIAESLYELEKYGKNRPRLISDKDFPKRRLIGIYDEIVCHDCEKLFGTWDQYGKDVFFNKPYKTIEKVVDNYKIAYRVIEQIDYKKLKLFFNSLLWRAHASDDHFFKRVNLGAHEKKLKDSIINADPLSADTFGVHIAKFDIDGKTGMLSPHAQRFAGINYYQFYVAEYICYIKVDKRAVPYPFDKLILTADKPLVILLRDFWGSKELNVMKSLLVKNRTLLKL